MSYSNGFGNGVMGKLMKDIRNLTRKPLEDIEIRLDDSLYGSNGDSVGSIDAIILGPKDTPFENGRFLVRLEFGNDFPNSPPKGYFLTKIFHPNVQPNTGEICVNTLKRDWKPKYGIKHILIAIRSLLIVPNHDSALNQEAGKLLLDSYDEFANRARMYTKIHAIRQQNNQNGGNNKNKNNNNNGNNGNRSNNGNDQNDGRMITDDDSSELDTTNENEEATNTHKQKRKSKSKSKSIQIEDNSNGNSNGNSDIVSNNNSEMTNDQNKHDSNTSNNNDNDNNSNNIEIECKENTNKNENGSSKANKVKSKDKQKKKSKKRKQKVQITKSMMRL